MSTLKERQTLIGQMAQAMGKSVYNEVEPKLKEIAPRMELYYTKDDPSHYSK